MPRALKILAWVALILASGTVSALFWLNAFGLAAEYLARLA